MAKHAPHTRQDEPADRPGHRSVRHPWLLYAVVFVCGAVLMSLEMIGSRMLAPYFGNSIFVWGSLISVVLAALSLGYWLGGIAAVAECDDCYRDDHQPQRRGEVAVHHFLPCLGMRYRTIGTFREFGVDGVCGMVRRQLAVAAGPVRAPQSSVGEAHVRAEAHHPEGQDECGQNQIAVERHGQQVIRSARP